MDSIIEQTVSNLRQLVDTDTVIGKCIVAPDDSLVIPVSKISVGMVSGRNEKGEERLRERKQFDGGGAGASITPLGFLVLSDNKHHFIAIDKEEQKNKWTELLGAAINAFSPEK